MQTLISGLAILPFSLALLSPDPKTFLTIRSAWHFETLTGKRSPPCLEVDVNRPQKLALVTCLALCKSFCETPVPATQISDTVGINIHLGFGETLYSTNFPLILKSLTSLGIRHVRDGLSVRNWPGDAYYLNHNALATAGIKCDYITAINQPQQVIQQYPALVHDTEAVEAPNEYDATGDPSWASNLDAYLPVIHSAVKTGSTLKGIEIIGPSLVDRNWWQPNNSYSQVGTVSYLFDASNLHNYPGGRNPGTPGWTPQGYGSIAFAMSNARAVWPANPIVTTEIGYTNNPDGNQSVPESVSAAYIPRVILEQFLSGIKRTYLYELADNQLSGGSYGLLRSDGTPKPAFAALKSLSTLLNDSKPPTQISTFTYSLTGNTDNVHHLLVQKSSGALLLFIWIELPRYDVDRKLSTPVATRPLTLTVPSSTRIMSASNIQEDGSLTASKLPSQNGTAQLTISDRLMAVQLVP